MRMRAVSPKAHGHKGRSTYQRFQLTIRQIKSGSIIYLLWMKKETRKKITKRDLVIIIKIL